MRKRKVWKMRVVTSKVKDSAGNVWTVKRRTEVPSRPKRRKPAAGRK